MTLDFLVMGVASFGWGMASDRFGTRVVVLAGAVLLGLGLLLASRTTSLIEFQLYVRRTDRPCRRQLLCANDRRDDEVV
jgi:MFS family permease